MGGTSVLPPPSPEGNHTLLFAKPPRLVFRGLFLVVPLPREQRRLLGNMRWFGQSDPEAWRGPRWLLWQAVAGQERSMNSRQPGPRERGWEERGGQGPWGGRHPGVFAQQTSRLSAWPQQSQSAEGSLSSELSLHRREPHTHLPPWERILSSVEQPRSQEPGREQVPVSLQASGSLLGHERPGPAWALWGVWLGRKKTIETTLIERPGRH